MVTALGAGLMLAGSAALGRAASRRLEQRVRTLDAFLGALELMERELAFRLTPLPELFRDLSDRAAEPCGTFFAVLGTSLSALGERPLWDLWDEALDAYCIALTQEDRAILSDLGRVLGRYDGPGQRQAVALARSRLEAALPPAREDRSRRGRLYTVLGLAAGCFAVILLL